MSEEVHEFSLWLAREYGDCEIDDELMKEAYNEYIVSKGQNNG